MGISTFETALLAELPMLRRIAWNLCGRQADRVDDLVQETALRALASQDRFEAGTNIAAWLITILRNLHRSRWRNQKVRGEEALTEFLIEETPSPEAAYDAKVALQRTLEVVNGRLPLMLAVGDGDSYNELVDKFGIPAGTIKSQISRTRTLARKALGRDAPHPPVKRKHKSYKRTIKWILSAQERSARIKAGRLKAKAERQRRLESCL